MNQLTTGTSVVLSVAMAGSGVFSYVTPAVNLATLAEINSKSTYPYVKIVSNDIYTTPFTESTANAHYSDGKKVSIISEYTENITVKSTPLTFEESKILSDNLFDLI